ncbi:MAG: prolyl oligopeptidase family serine peptidase, partial [Acidobacteriota bacterium]|nr:prolyl oligopeptidase family serine peptidase [Acidobacteriota bacterium]
IAYAPVPDVGAHLQQKTIDFFSRAIPDFNSFLKDSSPVNHVNELRCPIFLFHADDDSVVPTKAVTDFADLLNKSNPKVTFVRVAAGDHYDSMIGQGIPSGIRWAKSVTGY